MGDQIRTLTLKCPSCGSGLEVSPDMERFSCEYCGTEQMVQRRGGTVSLKLITDAISKVQAGTDKTAAELALVCLQQELADLNAKPFIAPRPSWDWKKDPDRNSAGDYAGCYLVLLGIFGFVFIISAFTITTDLARHIDKSPTLVFISLSVLGVVCVVLAKGINSKLDSDVEPSKESMASRAAWELEAAKLSRQEQDRVQKERDRILSQIKINKAIVGHTDNAE